VRAKFEDFPFVPRNAARGNPAARQERALYASPPLSASAGSLPLYLQLVAEKRPSASAGYTVDHTAGVFLFDANGRLRGLAPFGQSVAELRSDLAHLLAEGAGGPAIAQRLARAN
jgi:cytochrome oxidase Cu insertion factor (SCO1/SenC/PrrC family)